MYATFALACLATMAQALKVTAEVEKHSCHTTSDRNKMTLPSFADKLASNPRFSDKEFPHDMTSLYWKDMGEEALNLPDDLVWKRASETFAGKGKTLFGDGISPDDVNQGSLGNCWFLAAASSIAEFPGRMEKIFLNKTKDLNPQGIYGVNFWTLGVPHTVMIDDYLPLQQSYDGTYKSLFSKVGADGSLWTVILEKAFAKYHGNYEHIEGGDASWALQTMTGAPKVNYTHKKMTADELWPKLLKHDADKDIMTCTSPAGSDKTTDATGLVQGHAFTLMGAKLMSNGVRMLTIRNPWGSEKYHGNWSDKDSRWTPALKAEAGMKADMDDGIFHMAIEDFMTLFSESSANFNTENMHYDYFLKLDDSTPPVGDYTTHDLTIVSTADQDVYVTAHTWDRRGLSDKCKNLAKDSEFKTPVAYVGFVGMSTSTWTMKAGDKSIVTVSHDFSNKDLASDWSVVAWGSKAPVYVYAKNGEQTASLPVQGGPAPPTRPVLAAYDYGAYKEWTEKKGKESAYRSEVYTEVHDNHEWILVHNLCPESYAFTFTMSFSTKEFNDKQYTVSNAGAFADVFKCKDLGTGRTSCVVDLLPGKMAGFVAEPGFTKNNIAYSSAYRAL